VSTSIGAEGLDFADNSELIRADDPLTFAAAIQRLLLEPKTRRTIGEAGRRRVEASYSFDVLKRSVAAAIEHVRDQSSSTHSKNIIRPRAPREARA
jgi:spore maturation protein CgeB